MNKGLYHSFMSTGVPESIGRVMFKLMMEMGYRYSLASFMFMFYIDAKRGREFCFWNIMYTACIFWIVLTKWIIELGTKSIAELFIAKDLTIGHLIISLLFAAGNNVQYR